MKTIVTHPANFQLLTSTMSSVAARDIDSLTGGMPYLPDFRIRVDPLMERDKPTGRFVLPDRRAVERDQVRVDERFVVYGPEDIEYLLYVGVIHEEREPLFYIMDATYKMRMDATYKMRMDLGPIVLEPRAVIYGAIF